MGKVTDRAVVEFDQYQLPALASGHYQLAADLAVDIPGTAGGATAFTAQVDFYVAGPRFCLSPQEIHSVFPPQGDSGDVLAVLPQIILRRGTLPWENSPTHNQTASGNPLGLPWLVLLLFHEDEAPVSSSLTLGELTDASASSPYWPGVTLNHYEPSSQPVTVIDVPCTTLRRIMPTVADLPYLAHVRKGTDTRGEAIEWAVIIGNRLPPASGLTTVHLVSVENRYQAGGFDYQQATGDDLVRLVSLRQWRFTSVDPKQTFAGLMSHLQSSTLNLTTPSGATDPAVTSALQAGSVPLPYQIRNGAQTACWYRGPLVPGKKAKAKRTTKTDSNPDTTTLQLPAQCADALLIYDENNGFFDVSYAAAWELGRLLALRSQSFALKLFHWKQQCAQHLIRTEQNALFDHLWAPTLSTESTDSSSQPPAEVSQWFTNAELLHGVPFDYLVADDALLPVESIRFFYLDPLWIECLVDGAFSIGRVTATDTQRDTTQTSPSTQSAVTVTGLLLRSALVAGWPEMQIKGYDRLITSAPSATDEPLAVLRRETLSPNVLLCLFEGELQTVSFSLKPEALHFGLDGDTSDFYKLLRSFTTGEEGKQSITINWRDNDPSTGVIAISELSQSMDTLEKNAATPPPTMNSAQFALQMVQSQATFLFNVKPVAD